LKGIYVLHKKGSCKVSVTSAKGFWLFGRETTPFQGYCFKVRWTGAKWKRPTELLCTILATAKKSEHVLNADCWTDLCGANATG